MLITENIYQKVLQRELSSNVNLYKKTIIISTTDIQQIRNKYCI